jgi:outer membrane lipoprotein SlyB
MQNTSERLTEANLPTRAGVYSHIREVDSVVLKLLAAGFTHNEITIVFSVHAKQNHFRDFSLQAPAGKNLPVSATAGGMTGATLGGLTTAAIGLATGVLPVAIIGAAGALTGGVVGSLLGALLTRGGEPESADFYDQAVQDGKLLVVVEKKDGAKSAKQLDAAEKIFAESGARPLPLPEG